MALQSLAKETLMYINGELTDAERENITHTLSKEFIRMCSFNGKACDMDR
jgi:uncharacterized protein YprB with RNaseH-like and TPR domain